MAQYYGEFYQLGDFKVLEIGAVEFIVKEILKHVKQYEAIFDDALALAQDVDDFSLTIFNLSASYIKNTEYWNLFYQRVLEIVDVDNKLVQTIVESVFLNCSNEDLVRISTDLKALTIEN